MNYIYKNYKVMGLELGVEADYRVAIRGWEHISADEHGRLDEIISQRDKLLGALVSAVRRIEDLASIVNVLSPGKLRSEDYTRHARELIKEVKP